jgi:hypothetical protein
MPPHDDKTVLDQLVLIRAIREDWIIIENNRERLTSAAFKAGSLEASCFISEEVGGQEGFERAILPLLEKEFIRIATIAAGAVREGKLWIYRKPEEFHGNSAHVVICPSDGMTKSRYARETGRLKDRAHLVESAENSPGN